MNPAEILENPDAAAADLQAAEAEINERLKRYAAQREAALAKSASAAGSSDPQKAARAIVDDVGAADLLIDGAKQLLAQLRERIEIEKAKAAAETVERKRKASKACTDQRKERIALAEEAVTLAAKYLNEARAFAIRAIKESPDAMREGAASEIYDGARLIPALTQRLWLMVDYRQTIDTVYSREVGPLSEIFEFEHHAIHHYKGEQQ